MGEFYCSVCNVRKVEHDGDVCPSCQDPYQQVVQVPQQTNQMNQAVQSEPEEQVHDDQPVLIHRSNRRILGGAPQQKAGTHVSRPAIQQNNTQPSVPAQVTNSAPVPVVNNNPANNAVSTQNGAAPQAEGIVRNIQESKDNTPVLGRWMRSFTNGVPFPLTDDMMEFQVFSGWNSGGNNPSGYSADKVIVYGTINSGKPIQDNSVRVYGTRAKNNAIIASNIENTTDGTCAEFNPPPLSALAVRIITGIVFAVILFLFFGLFSAFSGGSGSGGGSFLSSNFVTYLVLTAIGGLGIVFCFNQAKQSFANREWGRFFEFILFALFALALTISFVKSMFGM